MQEQVVMASGVQKVQQKRPRIDDLPKGAGGWQVAKGRQPFGAQNSGRTESLQEGNALGSRFSVLSPSGGGSDGIDVSCGVETVVDRQLREILDPLLDPGI
ncbi:hypothetical protein Dimus_023883 [Dionaea muscipula]